MASQRVPFEFVSDERRIITDECHVIGIAAGIETEPALFAHYAVQGQFPEYFGNNWNALLDCLRDFSWFSKKRIVIRHEDIPLNNSPELQRVYLEILEAAVSDWKSPSPDSVLPPPADMPYVEHELIISFPEALEMAVARIMSR